MWFSIRDWVRKGGALPYSAQLKKELSTPTYTMKDGRILLEPKDSIKKRLKSSPDKADALALTFAMPDMPAANSVQSQFVAQQTKMKSDWNPFADDRQ
jgi:hypothetical protein